MEKNDFNLGFISGLVVGLGLSMFKLPIRNSKRTNVKQRKLNRRRLKAKVLKFKPKTA